jgi:hypothetical protein
MLHQILNFFAYLLIKRWSKAKSFTILEKITTPIIRLLQFASNSGLFSILFDLVTIGSYVASNSGLFCIPFDFLTTGSCVASNSGLFCIPFDLVTIGSYVTSNSGLFCIPFDLVTI